MNMNPFEEEVGGGWELFVGEEEGVLKEQGGLLPPGFRFHPTDEELVTYYLASKVFNGGLSIALHILEVDLNRCEPWELPDMAKMGEKEWYFFSVRDRKYPTGLRTNRATGAGYWKATGKDREVHAAVSGRLVGMKKTLVFYKGRAPRGEKTKWVLHEYRLEGDYSCRHSSKEEWVICRIFNKTSTGAYDHKKINPFYPRPSYCLDPSPSTPTFSCLLPLPQLQSIECPPIHSLLQNNNNNINNNPLHPLPQSLNRSSSLTLQQEEEEEEVEVAPIVSNWLDAYYYDMLPFGAGAAAGGGRGASHDLSSII